MEIFSGVNRVQRTSVSLACGDSLEAGGSAVHHVAFHDFSMLIKALTSRGFPLVCVRNRFEDKTIGFQFDSILQ